MRRLAIAITCAVVCCTSAAAELPPLLDQATARALAEEISGDTAKRHVEFFSQHHRMRGSRPFRSSADYIAERLKSYGIDDVRLEQLPADGKVFYGTQRSRPAWDAESAELWLLLDGKPFERLGSYEANPLVLAQDSESGQAEAELVDIGRGTADSDYGGKNVRGKFVLTSSQPEVVQDLAIGKYGAAAIVSYAQNQRTAWSGDNPDQVRWGHLGTFSPHKTFAFMTSLRRARELHARLAQGEKLVLRGAVRAGQHAGSYDIVSAAIPGIDPKLREQEIVFSCHLDHPRPGANDNASGCATILEVARAFAKLIREGKIAAPQRTLRFVWPPEIEGTIALLNARPEWAQRIKAAIHMDMVGGGPETKAVFHVTRSPASLPSFINDVAESAADFVNRETYKFAAGSETEFPLVERNGGKEPLLAQMTRFSMGSDHQIYSDSSWAIPAIYLNDWPDRNIHTTFDMPALIDATKLKRAGFIGAASAWVLATLQPAQMARVLDTVTERSLQRTAEALSWSRGADSYQRAAITRFHAWHERQVVDSLQRFIPDPVGLERERSRLMSAIAAVMEAPVPEQTASGDLHRYRRLSELKGPMSGFGYEYLEDKLGPQKAAALRLLQHRGQRGAGSEYAYEALNLANGERTDQQIRDILSAVYGPVPLEYVSEYLGALEAIGVVKKDFLRRR